MWLSVPDIGYVPRSHLRSPQLLVYDCIDPPFVGDAREHDRRERLVAGRAGVSFATAGLLEERIRPYARLTRRLPNACADLGPLPQPRSRRTPVIGYLGTIDWRVSIAHVAHAARELPRCQFIIGGRINADRAAEVAGDLEGFPNV
jgi:hypothetical protein